MPGDLKFSFGWKDEYRLIADQWNRASDDQLATFTSLIADDPQLGLMDAHFRAFFGGSTPSALRNVADNWFGRQPMWFRDSSLSVGQIHQVMRWSRAWTAELRRAGGGPVEFWLRCGHPRFRTVITWEGGTEQEAPTGGEPWRPRPIGGPIRVWVYTPLSSGYGRVGSPPTQEARALLLELKDRPRDEGVTAEQLWKIVYGHPGDTTIFKGTNLAVQGHPPGDPLPDPAGLEVTVLDAFVEPPEEALYVDSAYGGGAATGGGYGPSGPGPYQLARPRARTVRGIEVSWRDAGAGTFLVHDCDRRAQRS